MKVYEFNCFLRVPASDEGEARERAQALADAVCHGEATLSLDDSEPFVEDEDDEEPEPPAARAARPSVACGIPTDGRSAECVCASWVLPTQASSKPSVYDDACKRCGSETRHPARS